MDLDKQDLKVARLLINAWNAFLESAEERYPGDVSDFRFHIHALQNILASRAIYYETGLYLHQLGKEEEPEILDEHEPVVEVVTPTVEPKFNGRLVVALAEGEVGYVMESAFVKVTLTNSICIRNDAFAAFSETTVYKVPVKRAGRAFLTARITYPIKDSVLVMDHNALTSVYWAKGT